MNTMVIGVGSNLTPEKNIPQGLKLLSAHFKIVKTSQFVKNPPQGNLEQPDFINGAVLVETILSQQEVKVVLKNLEVQMGRTNAMHCYKPRIIDFDIHVYNGQIIDEYFYKWKFLRNIILELLPNLVYDQAKLP
ncbi:MAG: 2-amino-4-hydroxy-6-hydroxymethyldihydropteridine diphosphokinase [Candidatus Omnitrophica bacterium]|nr:2-amino-4-hydroxy-6-hydroxymethyldihydropteridine diphosphokinase [Candidatus Omnitrophota bacterium]